MHYLANLDFVIHSEVRQMGHEKFHAWDRLVKIMSAYATSHESAEFVGVNKITSQDSAWRLKKHAIFAIMQALCDHIKQEQKDEFFCNYWVLKTYGMVCMDFKDLNQAMNVFRRLKHECHEKFMFKHKMITYQQLGYVYRLLKEHLKATNCFKKFLQLAWFTEDMDAEI